MMEVKYLTKEEVKKTDVLKGMTAFPGKFSGRVKIILRKKSENSFCRKF